MVWYQSAVNYKNNQDENLKVLQNELNLYMNSIYI